MPFRSFGATRDGIRKMIHESKKLMMVTFDRCSVIISHQNLTRVTNATCQQKLLFQLMEDGVSMTTGLSAQPPVEEELRTRPELATVLPLLTVGLTVRDKALNLKTAIVRPARVWYRLSIMGP